MKKNSLFWALSWVAAGSLAIVQGCGGDDDDDTGATGGKGGSSGSGTGGTATGGRDTGGTSGTSTGGTSTGGTSTGGTSTGGTSTGGTSGAGGAPGGAGGEGGATATRAEVCTDYCQLYTDKACLTATANTYTDEADCRDTCNAADWPLGEPGAAAGNSVYCRLTHSGLASLPGPDQTHCGHASENSTGVCVD